MEATPDRIEKKVVLKAKLARVWRAISDAREFGAWFGVEFDAAFAEGKTMKGKIVPTKADPEVAKAQEPYAGALFEIAVDRMERERLFSFRWHPFAVDPKGDYSGEPMTLVVFELAEVPEGTLLTITETGFDKIPIDRRAKAFQMNEHGWGMQATLVEKYLRHAT